MMISAHHIAKRFGRATVVQDVTFDLSAGVSLALWGSNGAGKTTLIRCLLGVMPCRGRAIINGIDVRRRGREARACVGYVPQELAFHDDVRVRSAMLFFADLRCVPAAAAAEALDRVDLSGHESKRVRDLSGGMKQRLALAIALLSDPPIIMLDEPTSNLDAVGRSEVVETLKELKSAGKTLLFASHRREEVMALADRVLVMEQGRVARDTTPSAFWPASGPVQVIRLHLDAVSEHEAAGVLRDAGHAVHVNGDGLCVAVPRDRKAGPIHTLASARIAVRDLELIEHMPWSEVTS